MLVGRNGSVRSSIMKIVNGRKIFITSNGALTAESSASKKDRPLTILFIGRLNKTKGIENVLRLAADLKGTQVRLIVVGDAEFEPEYHFRMSNLVSQENIVWLHKPLSRNEILQLYHQADIFYLPSHMEGQSIVILDAIANGCIPVTSFVGGLDEFISHGKNGFQFDYNDYASQLSAIKELCSNQDLLMRLKNQTKQTHLPSWDNTTELLHSLYLEVVNGNNTN